jgi:hypothetical protein
MLTRKVYYGNTVRGIIYFNSQGVSVKQIDFSGIIVYEKEDGRNGGPLVIEEDGWMSWFDEKVCVRITTQDSRTVYYGQSKYR